jgi:phosphoribosyl 1,2-cyclic phosphate phosphodiesterase
VRHGESSLLIDISSEFRIGALREGLTDVNATLLTHAHSDHISGLDDLRVFNHRSQRANPIYGSASTLQEVKERFAYAFAPPKSYGGGTPQFELHTIDGPFHAGSVPVIPLPVWHGPDAIFGYRIGDFAFITDVTVIPDETLLQLKGLKALALDCLRREPHTTHLHLAKSIEYAQQIGAEKTWLIHMTHELGHAETEKELPPEIRLAYDGLTLDL